MPTSKKSAPHGRARAAPTTQQLRDMHVLGPGGRRYGARQCPASILAGGCRGSETIRKTHANLRHYVMSNETKRGRFQEGEGRAIPPELGGNGLSALLMVAAFVDGLERVAQHRRANFHDIA